MSQAMKFRISLRSNIEGAVSAKKKKQQSGNMDDSTLNDKIKISEINKIENNNNNYNKRNNVKK